MLLIDLQKLTIEPRTEDLLLRLRQSEQRREYLGKKIAAMLAEVEQNFESTISMLQKKQQQVVLYFREEVEAKF